MLVNFKKIEEPKGKIYAIGDIHGCHLPLKTLLETLSTEATNDDVFIFLGDYIDRGPDARTVIDCLLEWNKEFHSYFLLGNHEEMFLSRLGYHPYTGGTWFIPNGGNETLRSYGITLEQMYENKKSMPKLFPEAHINFLLSLNCAIEIEKFLFVHAGIEPSVSIKDQVTQDVVWIREPFLSAAREDFVDIEDKIIVHGHSINPNIYFDGVKIGLDTGCFKGICLSCMELTTGEIFSVEKSSLLLTRKPLSGYST